jgi:hypothetical protein
MHAACNATVAARAAVRMCVRSTIARIILHNSVLLYQIEPPL